jgi:phosphonate transport system permease protein
VVGLVGAGGIGLVTYETLRGFQLHQACAVLMVIFAAVILIDAASQWLRRALV